MIIGCAWLGLRVCALLFQLLITYENKTDSPINVKQKSQPNWSDPHTNQKPEHQNQQTKPHEIVLIYRVAVAVACTALYHRSNNNINLNH